jgi:type I restriction enzyme, S subunit
VSAVLTAQEPSAKYLVNLQPPLVRHFDLIAQAPGGVARLRELILTLAVQGKLVPQDPSETRVDISVIPAAINRLIGEGKVPRSRASGEDEQAAIFDELPSGWVAVTASNVFIPRSGNSKLIKGKLFSESAEHLYPGYSASGQDVWLPHFEYEGTAVILSAVGARCGKAFLAKGKWSAIANTHIIWPLLDLVLPEYSMLLLNNEDYWMRSGGAQPFVKVTETLRQQVFLPPLAEQSRIVTRVEELMQVCAALEASGQLEAQQHAQLVGTLLGTLTQSEMPGALADNWQRIATHFDVLLDRPEAVDALEQTILQLAVRGLLVPQDPTDEPASVLLQKIRTEKDHLIAQGKIKRDKPLPPITDEEKSFEVPQGWEWVRLGEVADNRLGKMLDKAKNTGKRYPYLRNTNVQWRHIDLDDIKEISLEVSELDDFRLLPGDLLVCEGGYPGRCAIWNHPEREMYFQKALHRVRPRGGIAAELIAIALEVDSKSGNLDQYFTGATIKHFVGQALDRYVFTLPPLEEQIRILNRVNELRKICAVLRQRMVASDALQSKLADVFSGG